MTYRIISSRGESKTCEGSDLLTTISIGCEIFTIGRNGEEEFLGFISRRHMLTIGIAIADFIIATETEGPKFAEPMLEALSKIKSYRDGEISLKDYEAHDRGIGMRSGTPDVMIMLMVSRTGLEWCNSFDSMIYWIRSMSNCGGRHYSVDTAATTNILSAANQIIQDYLETNDFLFSMAQ